MRAKVCWPMIAALAFLPLSLRAGGPEKPPERKFQTSDRCVACHNQLTTPSGQDVSIGLHWRASIMANSSRDPYWQGSVRRETIDHPESRAPIEDECSTCHMPMSHYEAKWKGKEAEIFAHLPFSGDKKDASAEDGVSCSVCHQIGKEKLGTPESFNGGFVIDPPQSKDAHHEYGPFAITAGHKRIMDTSTEGFLPTQATHIRESELCATCHTLYTDALGPGGAKVGRFPEQMPYQEWLHSDYAGKQTCQSCHMPQISEPAPATAVFGELRQGLHLHNFVGANFFMQRMLNQYRADLAVAALPQELTTAAQDTVNFLQSRSARLTIRDLDVSGGALKMDVLVENLTGHKLPTAYPSRRAWLHVRVTDARGATVFESGALNPDGSIKGNDNDADGTKFEPHYREITSAEQVQIFEPIMKGSDGRVTTGLLHAIGYFKDNRLLPTGFDKRTAEKDIAVMGDAADDPNFTAGGDQVRYSVSLGNAQGPFHIEAELWYQPIGFRWAHNLEPYKAHEPQRFVGYYNSMANANAVVLARAEATR